MFSHVRLLTVVIYLASVLLISHGYIFAQNTSAKHQRQTEDESIIEDIEIHGNRRVPSESILYYVQSKPQEPFNLNLALRDLQAILQMGMFDPLATKLYTEDGTRGGKIVIFQVKEYPIIRDLQYQGLKSATESEVLTRFKDRRVEISKESQFDPAKANSARNVLRELLAENGHPEAKVEVQVEDISATTVAMVFKVDEGPRVRVKQIEFVGDTDQFSQAQLRGAMKLVKEAGLFSTFTSKDVYSKEKLLDDLERVRFYLASKGYMQVKIGEPKVETAGTATSGIPLPLLSKSGPGLKVTVPIEVGRRYKIKSVEEKGVTIFQPGVITAVSGLKVGDWIDARKIQENVFKGIKDAYGTQGYLQADVSFIPKFIDQTDEEGEVDITLDVDEGRQFTLRRLEFIGNTNTRDVVMRREILLNEGEPYNKHLWDLSMLRLNQLGIFDEIKDKDAISRTDDRNQSVDIDLQVREKGRQQIQLNGGVSGYAGSFFGIEYSTNNFLGYGESLNFALSLGNRQLLAMFGFTEPYFLGKPMSLGFQVYAQKNKFYGTSFDTSSFDPNALFTQETVGGTVTLSTPMRQFIKKWPGFSLASRLGLSYSLTSNKVVDPMRNRDLDLTNNIALNFSQPSIITSRITPSIYYNTKNAYFDPTKGQSLFLGLSLAGGILGGDINTISPTLEYQRFMPVLRQRSDKPHVLAMRFRADHIRSFGTPFNPCVGLSCPLTVIGGIPIYERYYLGGENDIRGYNVRSISPIVPNTSYASTQNAVAKIPDPNDPFRLIDPPPGTVDPSVLQSYTFQPPDPSIGCTTTPTANCNVVPLFRGFYPIGGDTQFIYNVEYRIPIISVLSIAAFGDFGTAFNTRNYDDQIVSSNFTPDQNITGYGLFIGANVTRDGVLLNPQGKIATPEEIANAPVDANGNPSGFQRIFVLGGEQSFNLLSVSEANNDRFFKGLQSSLGVEFRVQMPVINVPFRLIFAYNPQLDRHTVFRFSVGRTF
ncbi:MAG: outer membrane protein assembly factor BamA [Acidobacteria bacterium]|nr:outer membrane protein assembly factor BamA [Acidobacteriota bacterium]